MVFIWGFVLIYYDEFEVFYIWIVGLLWILFRNIFIFWSVKNGLRIFFLFK